MKPMVKFKRVGHRQIVVIPEVGGFVAEVGCIRKVYTDIEELINDFACYIRYPEQIEKDWNGTRERFPAPTANIAATIDPPEETETERRV